MLLETDANTGFMHESFDPENPSQYTREWFAWANSMFAEMILRLHENGRLNAVLAKAQNLKKARSAND